MAATAGMADLMPMTAILTIASSPAKRHIEESKNESHGTVRLWDDDGRPQGRILRKFKGGLSTPGGSRGDDAFASSNPQLNRSLT